MRKYFETCLEDEEEDNPLREIFDFMTDARLFNKKFLEQRKVFLWGPVHDGSAREVVNRLLYLEAEKPGEEITFYINSPGGVITSGMVIYDTMQMISSPVATVCMGLAASMGSILLSGGAKGKRAIFPHGEVMIHQPSIGGYFQGRAIDIEINARQIAKTKELGARILAQNCGQPLEKIIKDFDRDYWMNAKEAVEYGIVDKIINKIEM
ncbi:MAG: ATP-dependent Clp protease proteolytic subunit [Microscillaceae bacterium]|nr:ATP-dependent Clp protease proteolytic subunit [Microscillaceae bacterium]MDW8460011.1 ATP-dependent Clp protease proteolytic subunit [Cytophagales bacterium]